MKYKVNTTIQPSVLRVDDNTVIPFDPANIDYQEYLKWLSDGNEPLPVDEQGQIK